MTAPAAIRRRFEKNIKRMLDAAEAAPQWRKWVTKHSDIIAESELPLHVFASQGNLSATLSCGAWSEPHPHADLVPLFDERLDEKSTAVTAQRLLRLIDAFKELDPNGGGLTEIQARKIMGFTPAPAPVTESDAIPSVRSLEATQRDACLRQITLASYGTLYLRGELDLEKWYRHGIFWDARYQFRDPRTRRVVADDFSIWLGKLREQGAVRISVHLISMDLVSMDQAADLPDAQALGVAWSDRMLIVHFANRHQCWALGTEQAAWQNEYHFDPLAQSKTYPESAYYAGAVDCYWFVKEAEGVPVVAVTDWPALAQTIRDDLYSSKHGRGAEVQLNRYQPYSIYLRAEHEWAKLPLLPNSTGLLLPHQLLGMLDAQRAQFDNDTHPKNEYNIYSQANDGQRAELDYWSQRLGAWIAEVQLRAANELRWFSSSSATVKAEAQFKRLVPPPPLPEQAPLTRDEPTTESTANSEIAYSSGEAKAESTSKWLAVTLAIIAFAALALFVFACAKIIVAWPWAAAPIALVLALYSKHRGMSSGRHK